jgi:hypothetical protein
MTVVATFPKLTHDWLKHELDPQLYRRAGVIKSGSGKVSTGQVLGSVPATPTSAAKSGGNTGNGTFVLDGTNPALANARPGQKLTLRFTTTTNVRLETEDGIVLADIAIGGSTGNNVTVQERIKGVLTQGATPFAAGDGFDVTVPSSVKYVPIDFSAVTGAQKAAAIVLNGADATSADVETAVLVGSAQIVPIHLTWPEGATSDQKAAALGQLAALGIVSHQR